MDGWILNGWMDNGTVIEAGWILDGWLGGKQMDKWMDEQVVG